MPERGGICPACIRKSDTLQRLLRLFLPHKRAALTLVGLTLATALLGLAPPTITRFIIDDVLTVKGDASLLYQWVGVLLALNVTVMVADVVRRWLSNWVGFRAIEQLRGDLFEALQLLPIRFFDRRKVGSLISRMNNDSDLVEVYLIFDAPFVLSNAVMIVGILAILFSMNWQLALLVLLPVPPIVIGGSLIWNRLEGYWRRWSVRWASLSTHLAESIGGIRVVKAFTQESREGARFDRRNHALRDVSVSAERSWLVFFLVTNLFMSSGAFFVWYFGGRQILAGDLQLGELMAERVVAGSSPGRGGASRSFALASDRLGNVEEIYPGHEVDPGAVQLFKSPPRTLRMTIGDRSFPWVKVVRAAPLTLPDQYIAFLDRRDVEICMINSLETLDPPSRALALSALADRYMTAEILQINDVRNEFGTSYWDVQTNFGQRDFVIQNVSENARWLAGTRLLLIDVDGNRFEIPDLDKLDRKSASLLRQVL